MARRAPLPRMFLLPNPIKYIPQPHGMWPINPCFFNLNLIPPRLRGPFSFVASSLYRAYIWSSKMHAVTQRTVPPCVWQLSEGHRRGPLRPSVMRRATTFSQQNQQQNQKNQVNPAAVSFAVHESVADQKANTHSPPPPSTASSSVGGLGNVKVLACDPPRVGGAGSDIPQETHLLSSDTSERDQTIPLETAKKAEPISPSTINPSTSVITPGEKMNGYHRYRGPPPKVPHKGNRKRPDRDCQPRPSDRQPGPTDRRAPWTLIPSS